jgi:hypothetical protein
MTASRHKWYRTPKHRAHKEPFREFLALVAFFELFTHVVPHDVLGRLQVLVRHGFGEARDVVQSFQVFFAELGKKPVAFRVRLVAGIDERNRIVKADFHSRTGSMRHAADVLQAEQTKEGRERVA